MKRSLALCAFFVFALALAGNNPTIGAVLKDPAKFDNKVISVSGKVSGFQARTSRAGAKYFVFKLVEGKDQVAVYGKGELKPAPKDGNKVVATGLFAKERKVGSSTFKNEIDVTSKGKDKNGVRIAK
jgi:hypothetical protein